MVEASEPTEDEIKEMCAKIRETWTEREHWIRSGYLEGRPALEVATARILSGRREL